MANQNLKDFTIQWIFFGLLFFSLMIFATLFTMNNNPEALGDANNKFGNYSTEIQGKLVLLDNSSNSLLNVTAKTNPEESFLGSRDSVATSYSLTGSARGFMDSTKLFMGWIFSGTYGQIIISVFVGMFGFLSIYFITKWIRTGQ